MPRIADLIAILDGWFDPRWAEPWDAVGLVCGDPAEPVDRILLAVDVVPDTVTEAIQTSAQLLVTHHPLLLTPVHAVPANDTRGSLIHQMIRSGVAHFVAHTNADVADPGVSDALAERIGLLEYTPLEIQSGEPLEKLVVFVPAPEAAALIDALAAAGAGAIGNYDRCAWSGEGVGTFRAREGARPATGRVDEIETVAETRVEMIVPAARRVPVVAALRAAHPYEEPAFDLLSQAPLPTTRGIGRVGQLSAPMPLAEFTAHVAQVLPATTWGVRAAGNPDREIRRVAVCGGSGGQYAQAARRAGADAFLTSDLKNHATLEAVIERSGAAIGGMAIVDAAHWATEAPWLDAVAARLRGELGTTVEVRVSRRVTDPWTLHALSGEMSPIRT
ncbi:MAG: Nif3-like dinuclear metal center hexameric protein [Actinomycetota bacterium]|nr:Nif3-like dinuclear metal center hexameric protein [Actinomycetota bacterium]